MSQPKRILIVEIRTIDNPGFDSSQINSITIDEVGGELFLDFSFLDSIASAVFDGVVSLGSNFRHPLLFFVQVVPGNSQKSNKPPSRRRRRRRQN